MHVIIAFLVSSLLVACNAPLNIKHVVPKIKTSDASAISPTYPEGMPPVYNNFDALAPIFQQQSDTTYVINFWATWCKPCMEELPYFESLTKKYTDEKVKVILVNLDFENQLTTKLLPFIKEKDLQSSVMVLLDPDSNDWMNKVDPQWSGAIPITIFYKQQQRAFYEAAFDTFEELEEKLQPFILK